ncbi:MAG: hypothetical protein OEV94_08455 [Deltaproteobacteria bacterium]|nr:hypothetical protein [Deltaproteobacteria bacterium]
MAKKDYPEYHKHMMDQAAYPSAPRRIKFEETPHAYLYRTGDAVYKIKKASPVFANLALKELYCAEGLTLGRQWAEAHVRDVVKIVKTPGGYALGGEGELVEYALVMDQLSSHYWMDYELANNKVTPTLMGRVARFLAGRHEAHPASERDTAEAGRPEHFRELFEEVAYQSKKYIDKALTQPMIEMISRPMEHFVDDFRKLFVKRQKKGMIVEGHGAFLPEHLFLKGKDISAFSPLLGQRKYRLLDQAGDVALFLNDLHLRKRDDLGEVFLKRYQTARKDRDLPVMLAPYQTLQAMRLALACCERAAALNQEKDHETQVELHRTANTYYTLAVHQARKISKPQG